MLTVAIQAGGQSRRMGRDKGLVSLAGKPLIEHLLERVRHLGNEIIITTNRPEDYAYLHLPMASDEDPGAGALTGLHTALRAARRDHVLVLACDMPFVSLALLRHLASLAPRADVIVPVWAGRHQTMHAIYARKPCLQAVESALAQDFKRMISFYPQVRVLEVEKAEVSRLDPQGLSFFNVNTPEDLSEAERIMKGLE